MRRSGPARRGFTLVEVLVALSILGVTMATVVALFSSGMRLREATWERMAFERDARMLVGALSDDLANLVPAGPAPMVTADSIVLWRRAPAAAGAVRPPLLVTYQWSGSTEQDSLLVRVASPLAVDIADHALVRAEFMRWARVFDPAAMTTEFLVREDRGARFGARATLDGRTGSWVAYPRIRAAAWGLTEDPDEYDGGDRRSRILVKLSADPWATAVPVPDPSTRLALMPDDDSTIAAGLWLPVAAQTPAASAGDPDAEVLP